LGTAAIIPFARHLALCAAHVQLDAGIALAFLLLWRTSCTVIRNIAR